ncbi:MAG: ABC transporter permease [Bryobacteraceae bacterium]
MAKLTVILRGMMRTPVFSGIAVLSLALGIGANTAMFSLLDQFLLRTLPVKNPEELVFLYHPGPAQGSVSSDEAGGPSFSYPMFREMQKEQTPFTGLAGARTMGASLSFRNSAVPSAAHLVSGNYFDLLGVKPAMGRLFTEDDDRVEGGHPIVVLSHAYWTSRFGGDIGALNQIVIVNGYPMTIVGVAQKGFRGEILGDSPDFFAPLSMKKALTPDWDAFQNRKDYWVTLFGRLKPGVTSAQADAAINATYRGQLEKDIPLLRQPSQTFLQRFRAKKIILRPGQFGRGGLREQGREPLLLLLGMTAMVLLICCANVANLQLARAASRMREIAVRLAMGASRAQLIGQLLIESCILAVAGGLVGLLAAYWTLRAIIAAIPQSTGMQTFLTPSLDPRVLAFCLGLSLLTGLAFGLFPALQSTRPDLVPTLKSQSGQSSATGSANRFRKLLVTAQVAISLLLLICAGLFARTLVNLSTIDLGLKADHLLTFSLSPKLNRYTDQSAAQLYEQLSARLSAIPGTRLVSAATTPAIANSTSSQNITVEGYVPSTDDGADSNFDAIGPDYFRTMGTPLIAGREFTPADNLAGPKVAVVNEAFVRHFLANQNPLGHHFALGAGSKVKPDIEIVGVVKDSKYSDMREAPPRAFYIPYCQMKQQNDLYFYVRTAIEPEQIATQIRREVAALDSNLPIRELKTMQNQIEENLIAERMLSSLTGAFAALATVLAAIGLYGVLAYNVSRRTREIGIRMALGAEVGHVRGLVIREVAIMLAIGTAVGLAAAAGAGLLIRSQLYGLPYWDPSVYASAAGILWIIALAAAYIPARRAARVDPMVALRYE